MHQQLLTVRDALGQTLYPYKSPRGRSLLMLEYLIEVTPGPDDPQSILAGSSQLLERYPEISHKVTAELAAAGLAVEHALANSPRQTTGSTTPPSAGGTAAASENRRG